MDVRRSTTEYAVVAAFAGAVLIGGINFLAVKLSNEELQPLFGAAMRFGSAALLLFLMSGIFRWPLPRGKALVGASLYGLLGFGLAYGLVYFALVGLSAGLTSTVTAAVPLVTLALAVLHGQERFTRRRVVGGLLALAGIAVLSGDALGGDISPLYFLCAVLGVAAISESSVVVKGFPRAHPFTTNAVGMAAGAAFLTLASLVVGEEWTVPGTAQTWVVLLWLVVAGSIGLFALFLYVIARWTASATVYALTLMPIVAVTAGVLFADERLTLALVAGGVLVMAAVYVGALSQERPATPEATMVPDEAGPEAHRAAG